MLQLLSWKSAPRLLLHDLAIPVENVDSSLIDEILARSKNSIIESMPKDVAGAFLGANPKCIALSVYKKRSHFVIWDIAWNIRKDEKIAYAHEFQSLLLHREIPIIGGEDFEGFLLLGTDAEIQRTVDKNQNFKKIADKLNLVENNIKRLGFKLDRVMEGVSYVPYPLKDLINLGVFLLPNGQIKEYPLIVSDLSGITAETVIRDEKLKNKSQIVTSLFESFSWRISFHQIHMLNHFLD